MMAKKYELNDFTNAFNEINRGSSIRAAGRKYGIPYTTLVDKLRNRSGLEARKGPRTVLNPTEENLLTGWIKAMAKKGIPVDPRQVIDSVAKVVAEDGRPSTFKDGRPGRRWLRLFLKRHPQISLRKPETLGVARSFITEEALRNWHYNLKCHLIEELGDAKLLDDPKRILNADESGFQTNPVTSFVLGPKGIKDLYEIKGNDKECITVLATFTANGGMAPPCVVYPFKVRVPGEITRQVNPEWCVGKSESGWMTTSVFYGYIANNLIPFLKEINTTFPVLFLIDGHKSHISQQTAQLCKDNGIILYAFLPNATHILQPADVALFGPLKRSWKKKVSDWKLTTGNRTLSKANFAPILETVLNSISPELLKKGFRKCGLYPFNADNIDFKKCISHESRAIEKPVGIPDSMSPQFLLFLESLFPKGRVVEFRQSGEQWSGEESAKELFNVWQKFKRAITGRQEPKNLGAESSGQQEPTLGQTHFEESSIAAENESLVADSPLGVASDQEPIFGQTRFEEGSIAAENESLVADSPLDVASDQEPTLGQAHFQDVSIPPEVVIPDETASIANSTPVVAPRRISNEVSPAFAEAIIWPSDSPVKKNPKAKKRIKLPDAIGAGMWNQYWADVAEEKKKKEETKLANIRKREVNAIEKAKKKEDMEAKKEKKRLEKEKVKKRKLATPSTTEDEADENISLKNILLSEDEIDWAEPLSVSEDELGQDENSDVGIGDFVLAKFPTKKGARYYVGKIVSALYDDFVVKFLRRERKSNFFAFPLVEDLQNVKKDNIVKVLAMKEAGSTARCASKFVLPQTGLFNQYNIE